MFTASLFGNGKPAAGMPDWRRGRSTLARLPLANRCLRLEPLEDRRMLSVFTVNSFDDTVDANLGDGIAEDIAGNTSLRAAIMEANACAGDDTIKLAAGTYTLSIAGTDEDAAATGDLDIRNGKVTIIGAGADATVIDANRIDRVIDIHTQDAPDNPTGLVLEGVTITGGQLTNTGTQYGGGIYLRPGSEFDHGTLEIVDSKVVDNWLSMGEISPGVPLETYGGGINVGAYTTFTLLRTEISGNHAMHGGGLYVRPWPGSSTINITDSTITNNGANYGATDPRREVGFGGGIYLYYAFNVTITNTTISNNSSANGGGIYNNWSDAKLYNCTISGNSAAYGGGFYNTYPNARPDFYNCTIVYNSVSTKSWDTYGQGGGLYISNGEVELWNTIVAGNRHEGCSRTGVAPASSNILGPTVRTDNCEIWPNDVAPPPGITWLGDLEDNGGPTFTHALLPSSPAIDAGNNTSAPATDQRGISRPQDGDNDGTATVDIGAYEREPNQPPTADAGGPYVGDEGSPITLDASASSDPDGDPLQYRWDFDDDGTWDTDWSTSPTVSNTWEDDWTGTVRVEVGDGGLTDAATASLTVNNVAPTIAALLVPDSASEGEPVAVSAMASDPAGSNDSLSYHWTIQKDSALFTTGSGEAFEFTPDDNGNYIVELVVSDGDGGEAASSRVVHVENVGPTLMIEPDSGQIDDQGNFSASGYFIDPGTDTWTVTVDFGDGTVATSTDGSGEVVLNADKTFQIAHQYMFTQPEAFRIQTTVADDEADSDTVCGSKLFVTGTLGDDAIEVNYGSVIVVVNGEVLGRFEEVEEIAVLGGPGNDNIAIEPTVTTPAVLLGGEGNDDLTGGGGDSTLNGGVGNDLLTGGLGKNVLIGGEGDDTLPDGGGTNTIIGGGGSNVFIPGHGEQYV